MNQNRMPRNAVLTALSFFFCLRLLVDNRWESENTDAEGRGLEPAEHLRGQLRHSGLSGERHARASHRPGPLAPALRASAHVVNAAR